VVYDCKLSTMESLNVVLVWLYVFVLKVMALWLAFKTRNVKITALNDSKFIAAIVYLTTIILALGAIFYFIANENINEFDILFSLMTFLTATVILGLTFIPKVILIYLILNNCSDNHTYSYAENIVGEQGKQVRRS